MMSSKAVCVLILLTTVCQALTLPSNDRSLNTSPSAGNSSHSFRKDISIQCNGRQFGSNLNYGSCLDAFRTFNKGDSSAPYEIHRHRIGLYLHALPWKWVSEDGRCLFDIVMRGTAPSETTTGRDIARAAWRLLNECVRDHGSQGGVVSNIGQRGTLGIIIRSYYPVSIRCGDATEQFSDDNCAYVLQAMPAEISPALTWGPIGGPGVDHELPWSVHLTSHKCRFWVWGRDGNVDLRDTMTWYQLWTASVMLAGMCARSGKNGVFKHMGANRRLEVLIDDGNDGPNLLSKKFGLGNQSLLDSAVSRRTV